MINGIYHVKYSVRNSLDKNQRLVIINGIFHVKYSFRNSLDKYKHFQSYKYDMFIKHTLWYVCDVAKHLFLGLSSAETFFKENPVTCLSSKYLWRCKGNKRLSNKFFWLFVTFSKAFFEILNHWNILLEAKIWHLIKLLFAVLSQTNTLLERKTFYLYQTHFLTVTSVVKNMFMRFSNSRLPIIVIVSNRFSLFLFYEF